MKKIIFLITVSLVFLVLLSYNDVVFCIDSIDYEKLKTEFDSLLQLTKERSGEGSISSVINIIFPKSLDNSYEDLFFDIFFKIEAPNGFIESIDDCEVYYNRLHGVVINSSFDEFLTKSNHSEILSFYASDFSEDLFNKTKIKDVETFKEEVDFQGRPTGDKKSFEYHIRWGSEFGEHDYPKGKYAFEVEIRLSENENMSDYFVLAKHVVKADYDGSSFITDMENNPNYEFNLSEEISIDESNNTETSSDFNLSSSTLFSILISVLLIVILIFVFVKRKKSK